MTKIIFDIKRDNGYGKMMYAPGSLTWLPGQNSTTNPKPQMNFQLGGPIEIDVEPTNGEMYWGVIEYVGIGQNILSYQRNVEIPDSDKPIKYEDLPDIDPETFFNEA